jgi:hypothetical protein
MTIMATNNKFIVERTNVLAADVTVGVSYAALDAGDFGWYGVAGQTYAFDAEVVYDADGATEGAAFSITAPAVPTAIQFVSIYPLTATTETKTQCVAIDTPDHGTSSVDGLNTAQVFGVITPSADGFIAVSGIAENASKITAKGGLSTLSWKRIDWPAGV